MLDMLRRYGTLIGFAAILIFFTISLPETFLTARNWLNITQQLSMLMVVAAGMTIVMVMGDFDLSVGSMASLAGIVAALLFSLGCPVWAAVAVALVAGIAGGAFNGLLVSFVGILPFVATLATLTMFSGAAFVISGGKTISGRAIPESFSSFARDGIPLGELGGVAVRRLKLIAFALTGYTAALAGIMYASRVASANPTQGSGLMLNAIAAVFLGTTMSAQGEARILATVVGVLILGVLDNGLTQLSVDSYVRQILVGGIIILAVAASSLTKGARR